MSKIGDQRREGQESQEMTKIGAREDQERDKREKAREIRDTNSACT
jgi:hypothetical protein